MCGIFVSISGEGFVHPSDELKQRLRRRGPDAERTVELSIGPHHIVLYATVLSLRGSQVTFQPQGLDLDPEGDLLSWLCWNGEAWRVGGSLVMGSDTDAIIRLLVDAAHKDAEAELPGPISAVAQALSSIDGPCAYVFLDALNAKLYFGRDCLGRRSLLSHFEGGCFTTASVADEPEGWMEVDATGIFSIDLEEPMPSTSMTDAGHEINSMPSSLQHLPFDSLGMGFELNRAPPRNIIYRLHENSNPVDVVETLLRKSLTPRLATLKLPPHEDEDEPLKEPRIAILFSGGVDCTILARLIHELLPPDEPIDLLNVAFENPRIHSALAPTSTLVPVNSSYETCPDRITARSSLEELQKACPGRNWQFVTINIPYAKMQKHRPPIISIMAPHNTAMDLSIASALYFAARGRGSLETAQIHDDTTHYKTPARVLFSGLGADELFAGYQRHATAFYRNGHIGLTEELILDISRLGKRNLGRDDRVMAHWSREVRFPFLDEELVQWAVSAPVWEKCGFVESMQQTKGLGPDKLVLRLLAQKLGLPVVAREKKRAIQFGARTAKMEDGRSRGTDTIA